MHCQYVMAKRSDRLKPFLGTTVIIIAVIALALLIPGRQALATNKTEEVARRAGKLFSIFSVVTFRNLPCRGSSSSSGNEILGTCLSSTECSGKANSNVDGNCASGFGVCCVFSISSCTNSISENCTYVQNVGYPSATTATSTPCITTITRSNDINLCQIRLDFENFVTIQASGVCTDTLVASAPFTSNTAAFPPSLCGTLTGQHMYFETGDTGNPQFSISTGATAGSRTWRIKVSQIECDSEFKAPSGCTQYFTGRSGLIESYNIDAPQMLAAQNLQYCIRQEPGYCSIQYSENPNAMDAFFLGGPTTATMIGGCTIASVIIESTMICGGIFGSVNTDTLAATVVDETIPFILTSQSMNAALASVTGFSLAYTQIPC